MAPALRSVFALLVALAFLPLLAPAPSAAPQDPHAPPVEDPLVVEYRERFQQGIDALRAGRHDEGIAAFHRCLEIRPEDEVCAYNVACGHALKGELDDAFTWLDRSVDWSFAFSDGNLAHLETIDPDLAKLRTDARFAALVGRAKELVRVAEEYAATPGLYIPTAIAEQPALPLLVVLHDLGSTKDAVLAGPWRRVAEERGFALLAPSGRFPTRLAPADGMSWFESPDQYAADPAEYERTIAEAIQAFRADHELDRERVIVAGEGLSTLVAFHVATRTPSLYRGCILRDGAWHPELATRAESAADRGLRVRILLDAERAPFGFTSNAEPELIRNTLQSLLQQYGFPDPVRTYRLDPASPDALHAELLAELDALVKGL